MSVPDIAKKYGVTKQAVYQRLRNDEAKKLNRATNGYGLDTVRGVDSAYAMNSLIDKELIEAVGRLDAPGRPMLYGTTPDFLRVFGINSISELPDVSEIGHVAASFENMTIDELDSDSQTQDKYSSASAEEQTEE